MCALRVTNKPCDIGTLQKAAGGSGDGFKHGKRRTTAWERWLAGPPKPQRQQQRATGQAAGFGGGGRFIALGATDQQASSRWCQGLVAHCCSSTG